VLPPISTLLALVALFAAPIGAAGQSRPMPVSRAQSIPHAIAAPPAVGVLLPLSGRYRSFGESCLRGIRVALGAIEDRVPVVRTIILDTRGESGGAAAGYQKLASDPGILVVLGPMLSGEVEAVTPPAQSYRLATLAFSQRPARSGGPLFRFSLTKEDQAHSLAQFAVAENGLRRWASFHPDDPYGREIAAQFRIAVESLGGRVVADVGYDPAKNDLQEEAKRLQSRIGVMENQPPPIDGVFLPDSADRLAMLVSYLTSVDLRGVQLLGASGWNRPQELLAVGPAVEGGVFVDGFFVYSFRPEVRTFVDAYRDAFHSNPGTLEAYGFDAAMLVREVLSRGASTRQEVLGELHRPFSRHGATGVTVVTADGRIEKGLFLIKVEEGTVRELDSEAANAPIGNAPVVPVDPDGLPQPPQRDPRSMEDRVGR
jgi:ABC-type branched-subunit amino acid transport system substrate-binding protein